MQTHSYLYSFNYNFHHRDLCNLEARQLFGEEEIDKLLFTDIKQEPSMSAFIKCRFEIISVSQNYTDLLQNIANENIHLDGFKVEYLLLEGDPTGYVERLEKLRDIGYQINGTPDYMKPSVIYSVCHYQNRWYFGLLVKKEPDWYKHKNKPYSFSNSINMKIAKALVSIASKGDKTSTLLDACCGVGTVVLEACYSGFNIEGCDINWKAFNNTRQNLAHYNYSAKLYNSDVKELNKKYDAAIVDLPYNLYSCSTDAISLHIITSAAELSSRIVIVSISDIEPLISSAGLKISDFCVVEKKGKSSFARSVWVCEKERAHIIP